MRMRIWKVILKSFQLKHKKGFFLDCEKKKYIPKRVAIHRMAQLPDLLLWPAIVLNTGEDVKEASVTHDDCDGGDDW